MSATKKKTTKKKVKTIDLTQDKTDAVVKNQEKKIQRLLIKYLKGSSIPIFLELAKDPDIFAHYFLNQQFYFELLGPNIEYLNEALKAAIVDTLDDAVYTAMHAKGAIFPGIWSAGKVYAIVATHVNIRTPVDNDKAGYYLMTSSSVTNPELKMEDLEKLTPTECMAFADYNPNRLFQFCMEAIRRSLEIIMHRANYDSPSALFYTQQESLVEKFATTFGSIYNESLNKVKWREVVHHGKLSVLFDEIVNAVERPLMTCMMIELSLSGLSENAITKAISNSNATVYYNQPDKHDDDEYDLSDIIGTIDIKYVLSLKDSENPMQVVFSANVAELMHVADVANGDKPIKSSVNNVGTELVNFFNSLVRYVLSTHVSYTSLQEE